MQAKILHMSNIKFSMNMRHLVGNYLAQFSSGHYKLITKKGSPYNLCIITGNNKLYKIKVKSSRLINKKRSFSSSEEKNLILHCKKEGGTPVFLILKVSDYFHAFCKVISK